MEAEVALCSAREVLEQICGQQSRLRILLESSIHNRNAYKYVSKRTGQDCTQSHKMHNAVEASSNGYVKLAQGRDKIKLSIKSGMATL